jgi:hypothetical protein
MKNLRILFLIGCLAFLGVSLVPKAKADQWDRKTTITFDHPVELPGIVLPAGTYVFRMMDYLSDNCMVEVLTQDEQTVLANIRAIPDYRVSPPLNTSIVFEERAANAPRAIKEWFFPDRHYGYEFVYPKTEVLQLAKAEEPQPSQPAEAEAPPMEEQPPAAAENQETQPTVTPQEQPQQEEQTAPPEVAMAKELPKTASVLPLTGLLGIFLLAGAFGLRRYSKQTD